MKSIIIIKVINNNVLLVEENKQSYILVGKGIGFGKKKGERFENKDNIEQRFISLEGLKENEYEEFITKIDVKALEIVQKILSDAEDELGYTLDPKTHVALVDHINFIVNRLKSGVEITNPFLYETKFLYPKEYTFAQKIVSEIKKNFNIDIPEDEVGFITLHLFGGKKNESKSEALNVSRLINAILNYVEKKMEIQIERDSFECSRFIMHLRSVINRIKKDQCIQENIMSGLEDTLALEYKIAYDISKIIGRVYNKSLTKGEMGYIALHLHKLKNNVKKM